MVGGLSTVSTVKPLNNGHFGFGEILLLYRGCPLQEVKLYCCGPVGTTELVLYREVNTSCPLFRVSFKRGPNVLIYLVH